ncbi:MAG TPA: rubrerythrin family protein [Syntrophorhabdus sp.]|jgi:rubrerythrin|nr:rubrerythrin family protein [Syntrophorhabdus sp.]MDI9558027.1 rubrerythrin family protein [Pseudomonadota bacterium]OPY00041.1 MAG: Rubrerythrin-2 [Syntrophorhabdus sp. PtaB.Bin027]OQB74374.1 MAG: Rubrerythrin-2 [Deltaproteobacteria bacterium ADurb.Bin135]HNQ64011.1 rubrerythrin family protein [Syntrophorhabdaceae bacterium]
MDDRIKAIFKSIYEGEAKAALRLKLFAKQADREDLPQIAQLFRVISFSEEIHGERALKMLKEIKSTEENLKESFDSETTVAEVAYDQFLKVAADVGDNGASMIFSQSRDVEDIHAKLYKKALDHLMTETQTTYYVCQVCGYVADGMLPDECPVCSAPQNQFKEFK